MQSDRYQLERLLGEGNTKRVHLARDTHLDRQVALALVKTAGLDEAEIGRVRDEARNLARLGEHPHIVTIHDILERDDEVVLVMEYLAGGDLKAALAASEGHRLPLERTLAIAQQLASALEHAHRLGVLHRDLNPANVWIGASGEAKLGDFGLAVSLARSRLVREGLLVTSVAYMAPEQALGRAADERGDLYSLGAVLYELCTGRPPFLGDDAVSVLSQHIHTAPVAPRWHDPGVPPALEALILRLLAKLPEERPPSAAAVREVLAVIAAAEVGGNGAAPRAPANPLDRLAAGVFVARDAAMGELRAGVESAFGGHGSCFLVTGEPGIGKTRLTEELATYARLRSACVLVGRCIEGEGAPAYWPWVQILRELGSLLGADALRARLSADAGDLAQLVPELVGGDPQPATAGADDLQRRFRLFDSVTRVLLREADARPLVLVLDDLHRADTPSLLLLQHLVREIGRARVLVLGAYRDVEVDAAHPLSAVLAELAPLCRELGLAAFDPGGVARFVEIATGTAAPADVVDSIYELTQGNPLFVTEVVRLLASEERLDRPLDEQRDQLSRSPGVRHTIERRLERLSPEGRRMLGAASVLGREFELELLAPTLPGLEVEARMAAVDEALATRMIERVEGDVSRFRFSHVLIRDALYDGLSTAERLRGHRLAAEAIEALQAARPDRHLSELAHHFGRAAAGDPRLAAKAVDAAVRAGDHARAQLAWEEAAGHYELALRSLDAASASATRRASVLCGLGEVVWRSGDTPRAREYFLEAAEQARRGDRPSLLARAAFGFAGGTDATLDVDTPAVALMEEALAAMPEEDDPQRAILASRLATALYFASDRKRAETLARQALAMAERCDAPTLAYSLNCLHYVLLGPDTVVERLALADRLLTLGKRSGARETVALGLYSRFVDLMERGDLDGADAELAAHASLAEALRQPYFDWQTAVQRAVLELAAGRLDEAEAQAHEGLRLGQMARSPNAVTLFGGQLYFVRREQGRLAEMHEAVEGMVREHPQLSLFRFGLAHLRAAAGQLDEARALFEPLAAADFADHPRDMTWLPNLWLSAELCVQLGDRERARRVYELLRPHEDACVMMIFMTAWCGSVAHSLGLLAALLGDHAAAERHFERALAVHRRAGARPWLAHTAREFARCLLERGRADDAGRAARLLDEASTIYRAHQMGPWLEQARALAERAPRREAAEATTGRFALEGREWSLRFAGSRARLRDARGLHYLARLLASPDRELHVSDLAASVEGGPATGPAPREPELQVARERGSEPLDATARSQYAARLAELREELADAEAANDLGRRERARGELEAIERELGAAFGLGGRPRRSGDAIERARKAVGNRIRASIRSIEQAHPRLGRHLAASVRTGTYCSYRPELPVEWQLEERPDPS